MGAPARSETVAAAVLAGGRAQRLGGIDKGLALWRGRPLIAHAVDTVRQSVADVLVIANRHHDTYRHYGRVRSDAHDGYRGPLEGIATALRDSVSDWLFVVPVDSPSFGADLFARLWQARDGVAVVVAHDGERRQPLFALYRRDRMVLPADDADMPVWLWQDRHVLREVDFSDSSARFANLNTAEDFAMSAVEPLVAPMLPGPLSVEQARERVIARARSREFAAETVSLDRALDRALLAPIVVPMDVPPFANSAMDGFALRGLDLPRDGERRFRLVATRLAGDGRVARVGEGECVRITTGAPLPRGADTVVIKENVRVDGDEVIVAAGESAGANTRAAGEDFARGESVFAAGLALTPARLGALASFGFTEASVRRVPRAVLLTTGDEIVAPGTSLDDGQIYNSNRFSLGAMLQQAGVTLLRHEHVRDDPAALRDALERAAAEADLVVSCGGVSAGEADFLPRLLAEVGRVDFWKVRMKPGMPLLFGAIGQALVFSLPGNPVSSVATFQVIVRPALEVWAGRDPAAAPRWYARLAVPLRKTHRRAEFLRASRECRVDGSLWVTPFARQGSGVLRSVAEADCLVIVNEDVASLSTGDCVEILPLS